MDAGSDEGRDDGSVESEFWTTDVDAPHPKRSWWPPNPTVAVAVAVLVVALVVAALLANGGSDGDAVATGGSTTPAGAPATTIAQPPDTAVVVKVTTRGEGLDPRLVDRASVVDQFDRSGPALGSYPGHGQWTVLSGSWKLSDQQLKVAGPRFHPPSLVVFDTGAAAVRAQVEVRHQVDGSGLVFRVADKSDYYAWMTVPHFSAVALVHVVAGKSTTLVKGWPVKTGDGMPSLGIHVAGSKVELLLDGVVLTSYGGLPAPTGPERIGLILDSAGDNATFDDFRLLVG